MRHWDTGDRPTDSNLQKLESYARWRDDGHEVTFGHFLDGIRSVTDMLPRAVSKHMQLPSFYLFGRENRMTDADRVRFIQRTREPLMSGLEAAFADPLLKRGGGADFSDRKRTAGEEIVKACRSFQDDMSSSNLHRLRVSVSNTNLVSHVIKIEGLMRRKRNIGNMDPQTALISEVWKLRYIAGDYHHIPAVSGY